MDGFYPSLLHLIGFESNVKKILLLTKFLSDQIKYENSLFSLHPLWFTLVTFPNTKMLEKMDNFYVWWQWYRQKYIEETEF